MKRIISILLSVAMMFLCAFPVLAETPQEEQLVLREGPEQEYYESAETNALAGVSVDYEALATYIAEQIASCPEEIDISAFNVPYANVQDLFNYLWYYVPECFNFVGADCTAYSQDSEIVSLVDIQYNTFADTAEEYAEAWGTISDVAEAMTADLVSNDNLSDVEKALILHDRLAVWNEYEVTMSLEPDHSIYGALALRTSVCEGYAKAYIYLLDLVGIEAEFCSSESLVHAWNIVYIDGVPYHVDVTHDDPMYDVSGQVTHNYFLLSTDELNETRGTTVTDFDTTPSNTTYDNWVWRDNINAAVQLIGDDIYCVNFDTAQVATLNADAGTMTNVFAVAGNWHNYTGCFAKLASDGTTLFYSTPDTVYAYDTTTGSTEAVFSPEMDGDYYSIYGLDYQDGWLICDTFNSPIFEVDSKVAHQKTSQYSNQSAPADANTWTSGDCTVTLDDEGVLTVSGDNGAVMDSYAWSDAPWSNEAVNKIVVEDGVVGIGAGAFKNLTALTEVTFSDSVISIGSDAFAGCSALTSIVMPAVAHVESNLFKDCTSLTSVVLPEDVRTIQSGAFCNCSSLATITIPDNVTEICSEAFKGCSALTSVSVPFVSVEQSAFEGCSSLTDLYLMSDASKIADESAIRVSETSNAVTYHVRAAQLTAFEESFPTLSFVGDVACAWDSGDCTVTYDEQGTLTVSGNGSMKDYAYMASPFKVDGVTKVIVEDGVTNIGDYAFINQAAITSVEIADTVTRIGNFTFNGCKQLNNVELPNSVISIGNNAFSNCWALTDIKLSNALITIGNSAFSSCIALESIDIPESVTSIGGFAFASCKFASIELPEGITRIEPGTFRYCESLTSIVIPEGVTSIGTDAFYGCTTLASVYLPDSLTSIEGAVFIDCPQLVSITIPSNVTSIGYFAVAIVKDIYCLPNAADLSIVHYGTGKDFNDVTIHVAADQLAAYREKFADVTGVTFVGDLHCRDGIYKNVVTPATVSADGQVVKTCTKCGDVASTTTVLKASKVTASASKYTYTGKVQKPTITVKDSAGKAISKSYYTITYSNSSSKAAGTYTAKVAFKGNYKGTKQFTYTIAPRQVTGLKVSTFATTSLKLTWTKLAEAKYYKVEYSTDGKTWKTASTVSTNSATVKSLKAGTKYQFRVTALDSTKKVAGKASAVLKTGTLCVKPTISSLKSAKAGQATVAWGKVTGASKYIVYKSTDNKKWTKVTTTTKTSYTLTKLTKGKKIYVKIVAVNVYSKNSADSAVKSVTVKK